MWKSITLVCCALAPSTSAAVGEIVTAEQDSLHVGRPDFFAIELPILELARTDSEALWNFLVDPETPLDELWAAGLRCKEVFPVQLMPKLMRGMDHESPEVDTKLAEFNDWASSLEGCFVVELEQERVARFALDRR